MSTHSGAPRRRRPGARAAWAAWAAWAAVPMAIVLLSSCTLHRSTASAPPTPQRQEASGPLLPVEHWRALFDEDVAVTKADSERLSRSSDSFDFYELSYAIDAQASMFEAVGDFAYARQGLAYVMNMIDSARPSSSLRTSSFHDRFLGWVSGENGGDETPLYESYAWRYVTRLLRVLQPALPGAPPDIRQEYARALAFTETDIVDKWLARGANEYVYRSRTHMAAHWALIAVDVARLTADPGRRARCEQIVDDVDHHLPDYPSSLHAQLRPHPGDPAAYWWSDVWGSTARPGQDVSHGNGVIAYVVEAHDLGVDWSAEDMTRLSRTLTEFVMGDGNRHPEYVDGTGNGNGWISDGWVKLGRYDPAVQLALQSYPVQNTQFFAAMAANARQLGERR